MRNALLLCVVWCLGTAVGLGPAGAEDRVEGAIWEYEMSKVSKKSPDDTRTGKFRIEGTDIFQPRDMKPTRIGVIHRPKNGKPMKGDKVKVEFEQLRGSDRKMLKCEGPITFNSFGEVEGRLIDSDGVHWNFKASRVQE